MLRKTHNYYSLDYLLCDGIITWNMGCKVNCQWIYFSGYEAPGFHIMGIIAKKIIIWHIGQKLLVLENN
jgi:hypothetical protein